MINELLLQTKEWLTNRLNERTTYDGLVIAGVGVAYLVLEPIAALVAYAAIGYGIWTAVKKENR